MWLRLRIWAKNYFSRGSVANSGLISQSEAGTLINLGGNPSRQLQPILRKGLASCTL